jgi:hypothetical protein
VNGPNFKEQGLWRLLWQTKQWANYVDNKGNCVMLRLSLQKNNPENSKKIIPEKEPRGHDFQIHVFVSDLYIPTIDLPILLQANMWTDPGNI